MTTHTLVCLDDKNKNGQNFVTWPSPDHLLDEREGQTLSLTSTSMHMQTNVYRIEVYRYEDEMVRSVLL